jgi:large subunit ribosomal protein L23
MYLAEARNTYPFAVDVRATKRDIKKAIEAAFGVNVVKVHTMKMHGKPRQVGRYRRIKREADWKKALVTLAEGDRIDLF